MTRKSGALALIVATVALVAWAPSEEMASDGEGLIYFLDIQTNEVISVRPDGTHRTVLTTERSDNPDGVAVDVDNGFIYWTNMGVAARRDGSVSRARLDGSEATTMVAKGLTHTPKQLQLDAEEGKLYWCDREGMQVQRSNVDGSQVETLVTIASGDAVSDLGNWCVGMALDTDRRMFYWSQKGHESIEVGTIKRAGFDMPHGQDATNRSDIEVLFSGLSEPIDLALDVEGGLLYWTDRGDNTVSRATMDPPHGASPAHRTDREILVTGLSEAIGISLDLEAGKLYYTDLGGTLGEANLDGSGQREVATGQMLTGVHFVRVRR